MKTSTLDKTFTIRQALLVLRWVLFASALVYVGLVFHNAWVIKMGGVSVAQMRYKNFPERCLNMVDIHKGMGAPMMGPLGSADSFVNQFRLQNRTVVRPIQSLLEDPECWGHAIRVAVDSSSASGRPKNEANVRIVFYEPTTESQGFKRRVLSLNVDYEK